MPQPYENSNRLDRAFEKHFDHVTQGMTPEQKAKARKESDDFVEGLEDLFDQMIPTIDWSKNDVPPHPEDWKAGGEVI